MGNIYFDFCPLYFQVESYYANAVQKDHKNIRASQYTKSSKVPAGTERKLMNYKAPSLPEWFLHSWLRPVPGIEKYHLSQKITQSDAEEIMKMIAASTDFNIASMEERLLPFEGGYPYRDFLSGYLLLMVHSYMEYANNWTRLLWSVLPNVDKLAILKYAKKFFA